MINYFNINPGFGDYIGFESVQGLEKAILDCGYNLPEEGLKEGIDFEIKEIIIVDENSNI